MSEEEIIFIIEKLQCECKEQENEEKYYKYITDKFKAYSKGLQGLLDLYNKEKEKNKEECNAITCEMIKQNYIHKDKIKNKMDEIMSYGFSSAEERHKQNYAYDRLKELLEEV